jgi:hypothetical protein
MIESILKDPSLLANPYEIFIKFIIPEYKKIPLLRNLSKSEIELIKEIIINNSSKFNNLIKNPLLYIYNPELFINDIIKPLIDNGLMNENITTNINNIIKNINKRMETYI